MIKTQFSRILLWEYKVRIRSGEFWELAPLLVLFEDEPDVETIFVEKELIKRVSEERERVDLLGLATMVAFRKFKEDVIKELFYKEFDMLKESSFVKEWIQEGREEGLREGQIKIILKQLERVLGRVTPNLEEKVRVLTNEEIEHLSYDLLAMKKVTDLEEWFRVRKENNHN